MLGDHNLTPYNHSKNRPALHGVECYKRFECVFLVTNWFWGGMTQLTIRQMVSEPRSWIRVTGVSLWGRDCWGDHNLTPYNHSKNRHVWHDVECHKKFEYVFLITNWFWGEWHNLRSNSIFWKYVWVHIDLLLWKIASTKCGPNLIFCYNGNRWELPDTFKNHSRNCDFN